MDTYSKMNREQLTTVYERIVEQWGSKAGFKRVEGYCGRVRFRGNIRRRMFLSVSAVLEEQREKLTAEFEFHLYNHEDHDDLAHFYMVVSLNEDLSFECKEQQVDGPFLSYEEQFTSFPLAEEALDNHMLRILQVGSHDGPYFERTL